MHEPVACPQPPGSGPAIRPPAPPPQAELARTVRDSAQLAPPPAPRHVAGYEIVRELGQGGMGVVYLARQVRLGRLVALKMIRSARADREELLRFRTEAESVARLTHPNIVAIHEIGEHDGHPFFSLEFCPGGSLDRQLNGQPVAPAMAASLVETLARAVAYAHSQGVVHRDLKPANVLLQKGFTAEDAESRKGKQEKSLSSLLLPPRDSASSAVNELVPKVTDFGLAKRLDAPNQTRAGAIMGTPSYMAPEQAAGRNDQIGPAADVYSLGAILYECLTGRPPFVGGDLLRTIEQVRHDDPVPPRSLVAGLPLDLETIALRCLRKEPEKRYANADELADDLRRWGNGEPIAARPIGRAERAVKWARRRPYQAMLAGVLTLFVASVVVAVPLWVLSMRHERDVARKQAEEAERQSKRVQARDSNKDELRKAEKEFGRNPDAAQHLFLGIVRRISEEDAEADVELARIRQRAIQWLVAVEAALTFVRRSDEAIFLLYRESVAGHDPARPDEAARTARLALAAFPNLRHVPEEMRPPLRQYQMSLMFLLAEATARQGEDRGRFQEALRLLGDAEELARQQGVTLRSVGVRRARYLDGLGRREEAQRQRQRSEKVPVADALDWFHLGQERYEVDTEAALACFGRALNDAPDPFWAQFFQALALQKLHRDSEAITVLNQCVRARPDFVWLYLLRGFLHARQKSLALAVEDFDRAEQTLDQKRDADHAARYAILANRGVVALEQHQHDDKAGHLDAAIDYLQRAALLMPKHFHAHTLLSKAYWRRGDRQRALQALDYALRLVRQSPVKDSARDKLEAALHRTRADLRLSLRDPVGALADLRRALSVEEADPQPRKPLLAEDRRKCATILYDQGRYEEALALAEKALDANPRSTPALRVVAEAQLELRRPKEALAAFDRFVAAGGKRDADLYRRRARARAALNDLPGVIEEHTASLALDPNNRPSGTLTARGWAYLVRGASRLALDDFQEALAKQPTSGEALVGRAAARLDLNQTRDALSDVEAGLEHGPRNARLLYNAARVLARLGAIQGGNPRQAQKHNERAIALLVESIDATPAPQRGRFWREQVRRDQAFRALSRHEDFARLTRQYLKDEEPHQAKR